MFSASQVCYHWRAALISSPSLWTRFTCRHVPRTIVGLERCKSAPIQLKFDQQSSTLALENILLHENKIASLAIHHEAGKMPPLHKLFTLPIPSVERFHIYSYGPGQEGGERKMTDILQDFLSLRELFARRFPVPIGQFAAPNLVHLALENVGEEQYITVRSILDTLRGCPLLETVLIILWSGDPQETTLDYSSVSLPNLHSIELGSYEVRSGLITYLLFPRTVAVGFRSLGAYDVCGYDVPPVVLASSRHVLGRMDIHTVVLAIVAPRCDGYLQALIRFEGVVGSLEMTFRSWFMGEGTIFCGHGVLFSFAPCLVNVKELQLAECYIEPIVDVNHLVTAMPNLTSICFFHCVWLEGDSVFRLISPNDDHQSPPFPRLESLTVLEPGPGLIKIAQRRKECGVPLRTVVIGPDPLLYTPEQIAELRVFVDDVRVEIPPDISEWSTGNKILDTWSDTGIPGPVSTTRDPIFIGLTLFSPQDTLTSLRGLLKYCRFNVGERFH